MKICDIFIDRGPKLGYNTSCVNTLTSPELKA